ncbi:hypothetical protein [Ktedonobacter robiniae]|uniref:Uncharacterized protein n=1 Tax=Ktedonobacter robiniae TaxID=2778365 RepID=A0ABQ3V0M8_9CHLR|nr:hypothetical protein [Ktedonobacter robiniae]GHO58470.1 hypothetical protein KSB_69450 [Ktedonobacter robiniae]
MWVDDKYAWLGRAVSYFLHGGLGQELDKRGLSIPGAGNQEFMAEEGGIGKIDGNRVAAMPGVPNEGRGKRCLCLLNLPCDLWGSQQMLDRDPVYQWEICQGLWQMERSRKLQPVPDIGPWRASMQQLKQRVLVRKRISGGEQPVGLFVSSLERAHPCEGETIG